MYCINFLPKNRVRFLRESKEKMNYWREQRFWLVETGHVDVKYQSLLTTKFVDICYLRHADVLTCCIAKKMFIRITKTSFLCSVTLCRLSDIDKGLPKKMSILIYCSLIFVWNIFIHLNSRYENMFVFMKDNLWDWKSFYSVSRWRNFPWRLKQNRITSIQKVGLCNFQSTMSVIASAHLWSKIRGNWRLWFSTDDLCTKRDNCPFTSKVYGSRG